MRRSTLGLLVLGLAMASPPFVPARLKTGSAPDRQPVDVIEGGQVVLELTVGKDGAVTRVDALHDTPPFSALLRAAVASWRFDPASEDDQPVESRVLVAALFRAPVLSPGLAPVPPPRAGGLACPGVPFPTEVVEPPYPAAALGEGIVLLEVDVGTEGGVTDVLVVDPQGPFTEVAVAAARGWRFAPACRDGRPVAAVAYLAFGFRQPGMAPRPASPGGLNQLAPGRPSRAHWAFARDNGGR
jgi:TonB family protein